MVRFGIWNAGEDGNSCTTDKAKLESNRDRPKSYVGTKRTTK